MFMLLKSFYVAFRNWFQFWVDTIPGLRFFLSFFLIFCFICVLFLSFVDLNDFFFSNEKKLIVEELKKDNLDLSLKKNGDNLEKKSCKLITPHKKGQFPFYSCCKAQDMQKITGVDYLAYSYRPRHCCEKFVNPLIKKK